MPKDFRGGFVEVAKATGNAFRSVRKVSGVTTDPDLMRYESFSPSDFESLAQQYGEDSVAEYIKEMEVKRNMKNG